MEELLIECISCRCNVDLGGQMFGVNEWLFFVRLRPWSNKQGSSSMAMGSGETVTEAMTDAVAKARAGRWERLDYAKRPWETQTTASWG